MMVLRGTIGGRTEPFGVFRERAAIVEHLTDGGQGRILGGVNTEMP